eukprot:4458300-Pleurochrysis_carterae.AAC.2
MRAYDAPFDAVSTRTAACEPDLHVVAADVERAHARRADRQRTRRDAQRVARLQKVRAALQTQPTRSGQQKGKVHSHGIGRARARKHPSTAPKRASFQTRCVGARKHTADLERRGDRCEGCVEASM